jgi:hypothetical protein
MAWNCAELCVDVHCSDWYAFTEMLHRILLASILILASASGAPLLYVVPGTDLLTAGNTSNPATAPDSFRIQEVFSAEEFGRTVLIQEIAIRAAAGTGPLSQTFSSLDLFLSTTAYSPNTTGGAPLLTNTFASNAGPDNTLVFSGPTSYSSPGCPGPSACPFIPFPLTTPFLYDPSHGNLLLDIQAVSTSASGFVDWQTFAFPPGGALATVVGNLASATGGVQPAGLIVQFGVTPVPEPSGCALMLAALGAFGIMRRQHRKAS